MLEAVNSATGSDIRNLYLSHLERCTIESAQTVMVNHYGEFPQDLVNGLAESVEELMVSNGDSKKSIKRVFSILIEALQNIRFHGGRDEYGKQLAFLLIVKGKVNYRIVIGNIIRNEDRPVLESYFARINDSGIDELRELYVKILNESFFTRKGGAGLGFLTMRLKSDNSIHYTMQQIDSARSFFTVEVNISRNL